MSQKICVLAVFFLVSRIMAQAGCTAEITYLDTSSAKAMVKTMTCAPQYFKDLIPPEFFLFTLTSHAERRLQTSWLIDHPEFVSKSAGGDLNFTEGGCDGNSVLGANCRVETKSSYDLVKNLAPYQLASLNQRPVRPEGVLRIAVMKNCHLFSQKTEAGWYGADVIFAKKIGFYLSREVELVEGETAGDCLAAVKVKAADLAIASLPAKASFEDLTASRPYFKTGAVLAAANPLTIRILSTKGLRAPDLNLLVFEGTAAADTVKKFPGIRPHYFQTLREMLFELSNVSNLSLGRYDGLAVLMSEAQAFAIPGLFVVQVGQKRLWTDEAYAVIGNDKRLIARVNEVIKKGEIEFLYSTLVSRQPL